MSASARPARSILFSLAALVAAGVLVVFSLPVSLFPQVNFPRIRINLESGDRPAERMELQVTRPVELAVRGIPGVRGVESTTSRGSAEVSVMFDWGENMTSAYLQAQAQINGVLANLPAGTTFEVRRMDPTVFPVIAYSLTSKTRQLTELRDIAQFQMLPALSKVTGVSKATVDGAAVSEIHVVLTPATLAAQDLALSDVVTALSAANVLSAVGHAEDHDKLYLVVADAQLATVDAIKRVPIRASGQGLVRLGDVADVQVSTLPRFTHSTADGSDCALINVYQQPTGNTVQIAKDVRGVFAGFAKSLPPDVQIKNWYDQSNLILESETGVRDSVLIGMGLAVLVLFVFLRDWRITLIAALSVPIVLAITMLVLYLLGQSLNIMTLGGMAAAVGLIIDDAIVISEHIIRRLDAEGDAGPIRERVAGAAAEFTRPLLGSSLSTIIIHIPPAFLVGVFGAFFAALSLSMASSLVISFLVAWLVIPVLAGRILKGRRKTQTGTLARRTDSAYSSMMRMLLPSPWVAILLAVPLLLGGYVAYLSVPSGVIPSVDEGGFVIDYVGPPGASIAEMDRLLGHVESVLGQTPEVDTYSRRTGFSLGGDISESNTGDFFVRLKPLPRRALDDVMAEVQSKVTASTPGLTIEPLKLMEDLLGDLTGKPQPVVVQLFGDDTTQLVKLAPKIASTLGSVPGLSAIESGVIPAGDALQFHIDREKAAMEGLTADAVTKSVDGAVGGTVATQMQFAQKSIDVRVWTPSKVWKTSDALATLPLRAPDGHLVPVGRIATIDVAPGQPEITRLNLQRVVSVTARSSRDLGATIRDVKGVLDRPGVIPAGVRYGLAGQYEEQRQIVRGVTLVIAAAGTLVFVLLLIMYERIRIALAILLTTALAIAAVVIGLRLTRTELNISSMMGLVMIVGNVTEVAIFYCSEYMAMPRAGDRNERLIAAGAHRLRAIVMTTLAAILALLPLALNWGHGGEMLRPLAIAIIAGLIVQLPLVLIGLPCWLALFGLDHVSTRPTVQHS